MKNKIIIKKTRGGKKFLAIDINEKTILQYLHELKGLLRLDIYNTIRNKKIERDEDKFHITVIPPHEMNKINLINFDKLYNYNLVGLGHIKNKVFYIIVESNELDNLRKNHKLSKFDYHITIGFLKKDKETLLNKI